MQAHGSVEYDDDDPYVYCLPAYLSPDFRLDAFNFFYHLVDLEIKMLIFRLPGDREIYAGS